MRITIKSCIWVVIFGISFAWVESAVVVYLREIYFDGSFAFPVVVNWDEGTHVFDKLILIELGREIATITMLVAVGWGIGRNFIQKFWFFIIAFGIWDIFYYIWLWVMIQWPESLMTWDLLFYIPLPWVGPIITPVLISLAMIVAGSFMVYFNEKGIPVIWRWFDWIIELDCGLLMIAAFCWDWKNIMRLPDGVVRSGIPNPFAWWLYLPAFLFSVIYFTIRLRQLVAASK